MDIEARIKAIKDIQREIFVHFDIKEKESATIVLIDNYNWKIMFDGINQMLLFWHKNTSSDYNRSVIIDVIKEKDEYAMIIPTEGVLRNNIACIFIMENRLKS